jgi:6-phosphogluconolactonase (cycloisomerase 2 family)
MRRIRVLGGIAGILSLSLGISACTGNGTCQCSLSATASKFAYVMLEFDTIAAFTINPTTGGLTALSGSPFGGNISPFYAASDPAGRFLYAVDPNSQNIYGFAINSATGALTPVPGSPFITNAALPEQPLVDPTGKFLYVSNLDSCGDDCTGAVSAFKINTDGSLTEITGSPYDADYGTLGLAITPDGKFLYAMNGQNCCSTGADISAYQVDPVSGALSEINGSPFNAGAIPSLAAIQANGAFLYVIVGGEGWAVEPFSINAATGALATTDSYFPLGNNPQGIDVDAIDNLLFVSNNGTPGQADGSISVFHMNTSTGVLTEITGSPFTTPGSNPFQLAVDRSCKYLYVTNNNPGLGTAADYVLGFTIDALTGTLTAVPGSPFATPSGGPPQGIVLTPHRTGTTTGP